MTRLVCIGDVHLQHGHRRTPGRLASLVRIPREGLALDSVGAWLWLGDVFHQRSSIDDRNEVAPRIQAMAERAPVVLLAGNHDLPGDLTILGRLKGRYPILVVDRPQVLALQLATGALAAIAAIPYAHKGGLVAAGVEVAAVGQQAAPILDAIFLDLAEQLRTAKASGMHTLAIAHATIAGSLSSVGQPMGLERDIAIDAALLTRLGDVPKIFGHIHKPQELHGAVYAGSIARNDFGEVEDKRYLIVEFDAGEHRIVSCPLDVTPLWHVEGDLTKESFTWRVTRGPDGEELEPPRRQCVSCQGTGDGQHDALEGTLPCLACNGSGGPVDWTGCEVRVRFRFNPDEKAALDQARILAEFATAKRLELDPIAVRNRAVRWQEGAQAATIGEKVAAFVRMRSEERRVGKEGRSRWSP